MNNEDIVICHADKGGAIVVQVKTSYIKETERKDRDVCIPLNSDPYFQFWWWNEPYERDKAVRMNINTWFNTTWYDLLYKLFLKSTRTCYILQANRSCLEKGSLTEPLSQYVASHVKYLVYALPLYCTSKTLQTFWISRKTVMWIQMTFYAFFESKNWIAPPTQFLLSLTN